MLCESSVAMAKCLVSFG